ncbi:hypothetical protein [Streptomyces platensis]|uniref:hypothetical protein n=1 Tax=Streptomyces platensis TaxID=58346 RepID=UPI00367D93C8
MARFVLCLMHGRKESTFKAYGAAVLSPSVTGGGDPGDVEAVMSATFHRSACSYR